MSSRPRRPNCRKFGPAPAHLMILVLSSVILFVMVSWCLSLYCWHKDRESILAEFHECANQYQRGGIARLSAEVEFGRHASGKNPFLVWLVSPQNNTLFLNLPDNLEQADFEKFERKDLDESGQWFYMTMKNGKDKLKVMLRRLEDGSLLLVGKVVVTRTDLFERFRRMVATVTLSGNSYRFCGAGSSRPPEVWSELPPY